MKKEIQQHRDGAAGKSIAVDVAALNKEMQDRIDARTKSDFSSPEAAVEQMRKWAERGFEIGSKVLAERTQKQGQP